MTITPRIQHSDGHPLHIESLHAGDRIIRGTATPHTIICVFTNDYEHITSADETGYWQAPIPVLAATSEVGVHCW